MRGQPGVADMKARAMDELRRCGRDSVNAVAALMQAHLVEAREELETAGEQHEIFRAQGRAGLAHDILNALTRLAAQTL